MLKKRGGKSLIHLDLGKKLDVASKHFSQWKAIPLAKGFYGFAFSSLEDMRRVLAVGLEFISWHSLCFLLDKRFCPSFHESYKNSMLGS